jgi:hypothetical protein
MMKIKSVLALSGLLSAPVLFSGDSGAGNFFKTPPSPELALPAGRVYPQGRIFPFSFYSAPCGSTDDKGKPLTREERDAAMRQFTDAGVTMIGPQYELNDQVVADARRHKVKAVYTVDGKIDGRTLDQKYFRELAEAGKSPDTEKLRRIVLEIVKREAENQEIAWWDINPEEMRFWKKNEMLCLKTISGAIREADPLKRPVFMYEPGHLDAKALSKTAVFQDLCVKGMYTNYSGHKDSRVWCRWSAEQETEAVKISGRKDIVPIALAEMFEQPAEADIPMIDKWVRHDVYSALAAGAKGVMVFSARIRPGFTAREKYIGAYLNVCRELNGPLKLGEIFLFGEKKNDITAAVAEGPEKIEFENAGQPLTLPSVSMACFARDNARWIFIVNSSGERVSAAIGGLPYGSGITVQDIFVAGRRFTAPEGSFIADMEPLDVKAFKVFSATGK